MAIKKAAPKATKKKAASPPELEFDFIKSNYFRVVHVDGAFGGLAPNGNIHMAMYSERRPIPKKMVNVIEGTALGPEIREKREERSGLVREVEVDAVMNIDQAITLHKWLGEKIDLYNSLFVSPAIEKPAETKKKITKSIKKPIKAKKKPRKSGNGTKR